MKTDGSIRCVQFFFEPEDEVVGFAATMRSPACLAMETMKSWISWRLRSAILSGVVADEYAKGKECWRLEVRSRGFFLKTVSQ